MYRDHIVKFHCQCAWLDLHVIKKLEERLNVLRVFLSHGKFPFHESKSLRKESYKE